MLEYLYEISMKLAAMHLSNHKLMNPEVLYRLWLSVIRNIEVSKISPTFSEKLVTILHTFQNQLMHTDLVLFLELIE
jgi:hypothetical protein